VAHVLLASPCCHSSTSRRATEGALTVRFSRLRWRTSALLAFGAAYSLLAAGTRPFTWQADLVTAVPIVALAMASVACWPAHPTIAPAPRQAHPYRPWLIMVAAVVVWELASELAPGTRGDHPTLSSMLDAVDRSYGLKFVVFAGWLALAWAVVRLGRPVQR
jgi:hypothetical protein